MPKRQLDALMWAQACAAMERAERLRRQFFHHATPHWEAPIDVFETDDALTILIALPGVELERVKVTLNTGTLVVRGERPLPPIPFEISGRHLANGCLLLRLKKGVR